jgi:hypothetical protein
MEVSVRLDSYSAGGPAPHRASEVSALERYGVGATPPDTELRCTSEDRSEELAEVRPDRRV